MVKSKLFIPTIIIPLILISIHVIAYHFCGNGKLLRSVAANHETFIFGMHGNTFDTVNICTDIGSEKIVMELFEPVFKQKITYFSDGKCPDSINGDQFLFKIVKESQGPFSRNIILEGEFAEQFGAD